MTIFDSIFQTSTSSVNPLLLFLALAVSLVLGFALAFVYKFRTLYTREFIITLTLLPSLMTLVIFLVNGSLGTSIAVAGTFSLIRFRSATSGSRELLAIFLSMIIGLAAGTGYLLLAIISTTLILSIWFLLEKGQSKVQTQTRRHLTVSASKVPQLENQIQAALEKYCSTYELISVKSGKKGAELKLSYEIELLSPTDDFKLSNYLIDNLQEMDFKLTTQAKKRKNL
ncbi:protein of unknown function [Streptococcus henryi]|uniref:DUF4956 domain-containing protein n=1 Tax=Streptococcus henryi TaxID=439219 RepID=A0A1G6CDX0_9STRE|nr:DUF4956 domain-containing protein [Streptococcus henryi]SDB30942.1 protein of unknown function [Streptococcus henryi]